MKPMLVRPKNGLLAALDIGAFKTACVIVRVGDGDAGDARVIGVGQHATRGLRAGAIVDMEAVQAAILQAVSQAEETAGETVDSVVVNVSAGAPSSRAAFQEVAISGAEVTEGDMRKVLEQGRQLPDSADRHVLHTVPIAYSIDGSRHIRDPRGMFGERLSVTLHVVAASRGALRNLTTCVARCHLDVAALVASPYAAGLSALVPDERELGATVIDMGGGVTSVAVFSGGALMFVDSVPIGGGHVTNDIARGLSTSLVHAERMKTLYGSAITVGADERETIDVPLVGEEGRSHANPVPKSILSGIIRPRVEEVFELVRARLEASGCDHLSRRVVLTGGASQLTGARELASIILDKQVRGGRPNARAGLPDRAHGPGFATCCGLIDYAMRPATEPARRRGGAAANPFGMIGRLGLWLRENF